MAWPRKDLWAMLVSKEMTIQEVRWREVCGRRGENGTWLCCYSWTVNFAHVNRLFCKPNVYVQIMSVNTVKCSMKNQTIRVIYFFLNQSHFLHLE